MLEMITMVMMAVLSGLGLNVMLVLDSVSDLLRIGFIFPWKSQYLDNGKLPMRELTSLNIYHKALSLFVPITKMNRNYIKTKKQGPIQSFLYNFHQE